MVQISPIATELISTATSSDPHELPEFERVFFLNESTPRVWALGDDSNETIALHMKNVHSGKIYQCNDCDKVFRAKGNLIRHFKITHSTKEEIIKTE